MWRGGRGGRIGGGKGSGQALTGKPEKPSWIPRSNAVQGKLQLLHVVLWPPHPCVVYLSVHTYRHIYNRGKKQKCYIKHTHTHVSLGTPWICMIFMIRVSIIKFILIIVLETNSYYIPMLPWLAWNSQRPASLCLPSPEIKGACGNTQSILI